VLQERRTKLTNSQSFKSVSVKGVVMPPEAPQAGADLRAARERLAWPLPDVAQSLHIRASYLAALEEGHLGLLPSNAYALGFLRAYASALGLDPEEMLRRFRAEAADVSRRTELAFPAPVPERGLPAGAVVLLGLLLAVGVYIGWYRLSGEGSLPAETVMNVPERLAPLAEQAVRFTDPPAPHPAAVASSSPPGPTPDTFAPEEPSPAVPAYSPSSAAAAQVNPLPPRPAGSPSDLAAATDQPRLMLRANADAWMQVKDRAGTIFLNRILKVGELWPVPPKANLLLTTGNAGGTEILLDGTATGPLGASGAVRRDLPLDPDMVKDGKLAASVSPTAAARPQQ
jgi:cytoskeleton protein RodZ